MRILKDIIDKLEGLDPDLDYFQHSVKDRDRLASVLWDEVYGKPYLNDMKTSRRTKPLEAHYDILVYLIGILYDFEGDDEYELCDVVHRLINITEDKIKTLNRYYADTDKKTK